VTNFTLAAEHHRVKFRKAVVDFSFKGTLGWLERAAKFFFYFVKNWLAKVSFI
jgi:hypothetical protein